MFEYTNNSWLKLFAILFNIWQVRHYCFRLNKAVSLAKQRASYVNLMLSSKDEAVLLPKCSLAMSWFCRLVLLGWSVRIFCEALMLL